MQRNYWNILLDEVLNKTSTRYFACIPKPKAHKRKKRRIFKMYNLGEKFKDICFSRREAECMMYLLSGKGTIGIAKRLGLSPRTIEFYIRNMKKKLNCHSKFELIDLVMDSDFSDNVDFA